MKQEIHSSGKVYPLSYSMKKNEDGAWIISNVLIDGINLGKTLRNQFRLAAQKNNGNLDVKKIMGNLWEILAHNGPFEAISGHREHQKRVRSINFIQFEPPKALPGLPKGHFWEI